MIVIIIKSLLTFLIIYGFVNLIEEVMQFFSNDNKNNNTDAIIVIKVKNSAETLEGAVRSVILRSLKYSYGGTIPDILIVDLGSEDETSEIAKRLCEDYPFIYYTTEELYNKAKGKSNEI